MNFFEFIGFDSQKRNWFPLNHTNSISRNMGYITPILLEPTLPNDFHECQISGVTRFETMVAPPFSRLHETTFAFYVPLRLYVKDWDDYLPSAVSGKVADPSALIPRISLGELASLMIIGLMHGYSESLTEPVQVGSVLESALIGNYPFAGSLMDYLGVPVRIPAFSRDSLMSAAESGFSAAGISLTTPFDSSIFGDDSPIFTQFRSSISSSLGFGDGSLSQFDFCISLIPFLLYADIWSNFFRQQYIQTEFDRSDFVEYTWSASPNIGLVSAVFYLGFGNNDFQSFYDAVIWLFESLFKLRRRDWSHDYLTSALPYQQLGVPAPVVIGEDGYFTIPELRESNWLQRMSEKLLLGGSRPWEINKNFFGSKVNDARYQLPEFIKASDRLIKISDVYQTSDTSSTPDNVRDSMVGRVAGKATGYGQNLYFKQKCDEHGYLICLSVVCPEPVYMQGLPRHFQTFDPADLGWPDAAELSEQPVYDKEVYLTSDSLANQTVFGWQSQYAWYKYHNNEIHGEFVDELDFWHFGRIFDGKPNLNSAFLECSPTDRPFPISYEYDKLKCHYHFDHSVQRALPFFGLPSLR